MSPETIAVAASLTGYAVGVGAEQIAQHKAAQKQARLSEAAGMALAQETDSNRDSAVRRRLGRSVLAPLALTLGVAAGVEAYAFAPTEQPAPQAAGLEVVVDHSGATNLALGQTPVRSKIDSLVDQFSKHRVQGSALVAGSGRVRKMPFSAVKNDTPFGDAPLEQATSLAIDNASTTQGKESKEGKSTGVLVITNGNSIGKPRALEATASQNKTPIFIFNVEKSSQSNQTVAAQLRRVAHASRGHYWSANEHNVSRVADRVSATLAPAEPSPLPDNDKLILKILGAASLIAAAKYFSRRKNYALGTGPRGE